jgi:hypothetical protein
MLAVVGQMAPPASSQRADQFGCGTFHGLRITPSYVWKTKDVRVCDVRELDYSRRSAILGMPGPEDERAGNWGWEARTGRQAAGLASRLVEQS